MSVTDAVRLDPEETQMLAYQLCVQRLADPWDWCLWEDVPMLDEQGHVLLCDAIEDVRVSLTHEMAREARANDVDPAEVLRF